jgi:hypothetical protein
MTEKTTAVNWRPAELEAWKPPEGRELSADMAIWRLRQLESDVERFYLQLQVIRRMLELERGGRG